MSSTCVPDSAASKPGAHPVAAEKLPPSVLRDQLTYTSCYCEENVYKLLQLLHAQLRATWDVWVVIVSNRFKSVPIWRQRSAAASDAPVVWDYHVFLLARSQASGQSAVYDLDSTLPLPCPWPNYAKCALIRSDVLPARYQRWYRLVPALDYLQHFASDRAHMRDANGGWLQPPPSYPCITEALGGLTNTLPLFLDFEEAGCLRTASARAHSHGTANYLGVLMAEAELFERFGAPGLLS